MTNPKGLVEVRFDKEGGRFVDVTVAQKRIKETIPFTVRIHKAFTSDELNVTVVQFRGLRPQEAAGVKSKNLTLGDMTAAKEARRTESPRFLSYCQKHPLITMRPEFLQGITGLKAFLDQVAAWHPEFVKGGLLLSGVMVDVAAIAAQAPPTKPGKLLVVGGTKAAKSGSSS